MRAKRISRKKSKKNVYRKKFNRSKSRRKNTKRKIRNRRNKKMKGGAEAEPKTGPGCNEVQESGILTFSISEGPEGPEGTKVPEQHFLNCINLTQVNLTGFTSIGNEAFSNCNNLTVINLNDITEIGDNVFKGCAALKNVELPNVTSIGDSAFEESGLVSLTIPNCCKSIGKNAFRGSKLFRIKFDLKNDEKISIGDNAFENCTILSKVEFFVSNKPIGAVIITNKALFFRIFYGDKHIHPHQHPYSDRYLKQEKDDPEISEILEYFNFGNNIFNGSFPEGTLHRTLIPALFAKKSTSVAR